MGRMTMDKNGKQTMKFHLSEGVLTKSSLVFQPGFSLGWYALFRMSAAFRGGGAKEDMA